MTFVMMYDGFTHIVEEETLHDALLAAFPWYSRKFYLGQEDDGYDLYLLNQDRLVRVRTR